MNLINDLISNPQTFVNKFYIDLFGQLESPYINKELNRFLNLDQLKQIGLNEYTYRDLKLEIKEVFYLDLKYFRSLPSRDIEDEFCSLNHIKGLKYIGTDPYTQKILINFILNYLLEEKSKHILSYHDFSIYKSYEVSPYGLDYKKYGIINLENTNVINLSRMRFEDKLKPYRSSQSIIEDRKNYQLYPRETSLVNQETQVITMSKQFILEIINQMGSLLDYLSKEYFFYHGNLLTKNVYLTESLTLKISNFENSSLILNIEDQDYKLYPRTWYEDNFLDTEILTYYINQKNQETYFKLPPQFNPQDYHTALFSTTPIYMALDFYIFILSFLLHSEVFYAVFSNKELINKIWDPIFFKEDRNKVFERLYDAVIRQKNNNLETIFHMLNNIKLKCDPFNYFSKFE